MAASFDQHSHDPRPIKTLFFDFMGTCLDWHQTITSTLLSVVQMQPTQAEASELALAWRQAFFDEIHRRFEAGKQHEDIDETHRKTLVRILRQSAWSHYNFSEEELAGCVNAWHRQFGTIGSARSRYCAY